MSFLKFINSKIKNLDILDIQLIKLSTFFFALMLASIFPILISLDWYYYLIIFLLFGIRPIYKFFFK